MKRGKVDDDDKSMGPLFPRLHVNDTEKGGPRAPPRNKMALYEQLTTPSQRFNNLGNMPLTTGTSSSLVPSSSKSQGAGRESNSYFTPYSPSGAPSSDQVQLRQPEAASVSNKSEELANRRKPIEEDDFAVPIFSQPGLGPCNGKSQNSNLWERGALNSSHPGVSRNISNKDTNDTSSGHLISRHQIINQDGRNSRVSDASIRFSDVSSKAKHCGRGSEDTSIEREHQGKHRLSSVGKNGEGASNLPSDCYEGDISLSMHPISRGGLEYRNGNQVGSGVHRVQGDFSLKRTIDRCDDASETSVVDCGSGLEISPDDVVEIIGQKHFWKARTAILKQQRVFAVQVFELHRLLKVQKLIAGSPHLLLEGGAFVSKISLKRSAVKQHSSEYAVKALAHTANPKGDSQKPSDRTEGTAENAVSKDPVPPSQSGVQPVGPQSFPVNLSSPPVNMDPKMSPWGFHHPSPHQWLVPVMSPSEGLVYKPYTPPGFMGSICGGCGPAGPMSAPYGMPTPNYHQGMGVPPGIHFGGQGYFPPYNMPMMSSNMSGSAVDQMSPFAGPNPFTQVAGSMNLNGQQHQGSCNIPSQNNTEAGTPVTRTLPSREGELQQSTASSPKEPRAQEKGGRDALTLFPIAPAKEISDGAPTEAPARVIKVVPLNPKSSRESAVRIFQSIQEERRLHESTD